MTWCPSTTRNLRSAKDCPTTPWVTKSPNHWCPISCAMVVKTPSRRPCSQAGRGIVEESGVVVDDAAPVFHRAKRGERIGHRSTWSSFWAADSARQSSGCSRRGSASSTRARRPRWRRLPSVVRIRSLTPVPCSPSTASNFQPGVDGDQVARHCGRALKDDFLQPAGDRRFFRDRHVGHGHQVRGHDEREVVGRAVDGFVPAGGIRGARPSAPSGCRA